MKKYIRLFNTIKYLKFTQVYYRLFYFIKNRFTINKCFNIVDGKIITSRGPGTAICFALEIVKEVISEEKYEAVKNGMLANC